MQGNGAPLLHCLLLCFLYLMIVPYAFIVDNSYFSTYGEELILLNNVCRVDIIAQKTAIPPAYLPPRIIPEDQHPTLAPPDSILILYQQF